MENKPNQSELLKVKLTTGYYISRCIQIIQITNNERLVSTTLHDTTWNKNLFMVKNNIHREIHSGRKGTDWTILSIFLNFLLFSSSSNNAVWSSCSVVKKEEKTDEQEKGNV